MRRQGIRGVIGLLMQARVFSREQTSMHFNVAGTNSSAKEIKLDVGMIRKQRHRDGSVDDALANHKRGETQAERTVMVPRVPD